jgi:hypothetical protein
VDAVPIPVMPNHRHARKNTNFERPQGRDESRKGVENA